MLWDSTRNYGALNCVFSYGVEGAESARGRGNKQKSVVTNGITLKATLREEGVAKGLRKTLRGMRSEGRAERAESVSLRDA